MELKERNARIIKVSLVGIASNVMLCVAKGIAGFLAGSVAVVMDAVNNLSDSLSSVITIIGAKLSQKPADREHPFGHGRAEYFADMVIALIVLSAGVMSATESVRRIFDPLEPEYTSLTLGVIIVSTAAKLVLGLYVGRQGRLLDSGSLKASGADALFDALVTLTTLLSALTMLIFGLNLDGWLGTAISLIIIKAGLGMLKDPVDDLLGKSISHDLTARIAHEVCSFKEVHGVYDIILNSYGRGTMIGSLHIGVDDTMNARQIHGLCRRIMDRIHEKFGIIMTIGIYACCTSNEEIGLERQVMNFARSYPGAMHAHAFYHYPDRNLVTIDIVVDDSVHDDDKFRKDFARAISEKIPGYSYNVYIDHFYTDARPGERRDNNGNSDPGLPEDDF